MKRAHWLIAPLLVLASACAATSTSPFDVRGFAAPSAGFRVDYDDTSMYSLLGSEWVVDNYPLAANGRPLASRTAPIDLVLRNRTFGSTIWADSVVIGSSVERADLRTLGENYVASIGTGGYFGASIEPRFLGAARFRTRVLESRSISVGGQAGIAMLIDLGTDEPTPGLFETRSPRCLLVLVRMAHPNVRHFGDEVASEPLVLVSGYANTAEGFDAQIPDFIQFLDSIHFIESN